MNPNTIALHKMVYGSGDPILCLHGLGANSYSWRHFIEPFSKNNKLILVDFRGCGESPKPTDKNYSAKTHAEDIYNLIIEEDLKNLTIVGNSFGGGIGLMLAIRLSKEAPERLAKLILIDAGAYKQFMPRYLKLLRTFVGPAMTRALPAKAAARFVLTASYYDRKKISNEQVVAYARPFSSREARHALLETTRQMVPSDIDETIGKLGEITVPTLVLSGRQDRVVPLAAAELLHRAIPNSTLEVLEQCGHIPQEEKPEETIARISRFLATGN